jgi:hypothetical protein
MTQIKFTLESGLVAAFKARCVSEEISMTSAIRQLMASCQPIREAGVKTLTRPQRRKAVKYATELLNEVLRNEEAYRDAIPEQFDQRIETANEACECLAEAIDRLEDAYG